MTFNQRFSVVALFFLGLTAQAKEDALFLEAVAQVESGCDRKAVGRAGERGMYQVGKAAWDDANAKLEAKGIWHNQWSKWRNAVAQDMIAATHLATIRERFAGIGIPSPTPEQLAVVWNKGFHAAQHDGFRPNPYAVRVANLFRLSQRQPAAK